MNRSRRRASGTGLSDIDRRFPTIGIQQRNGTMWRGDWITSFNWLRRHRAFAAFPGGPLLDLSFERVVPHHVLTGSAPGSTNRGFMPASSSAGATSPPL